MYRKIELPNSKVLFDMPGLVPAGMLSAAVHASVQNLERARIYRVDCNNYSKY